ncbi:MAG: class I SAM-dependent methyltransferase [Candidatus Poribacteria bacterium]|nr:class I SAM-dependent methyltransferase [Candidatus Poribacteria bacterium]
MRAFHPLSDLGEVFVPTQFRELASDDASLKHFSDSDLGRFDRIFTHLRRGRVAVLSGRWDRIVEVLDYAERKKKELAPRTEKPKRRRDFNARDKRPNRNESASAMSRLMCYADEAGNLQIDPPPSLPYLLELVGEMPGANEDRPFLLPIATVQKLESALSEEYPIPALGSSLVAFENVLAPRSQETIACFQDGLQAIKPHLPKRAEVLEVGCGSGCLTLLAAQELIDLEAKILASDLLPEAVATTRYNVTRSSNHTGLIQLLPPGDLFEPVPDGHRFDLIIFNAPWVVSRARNRAELGIHDEGQRIVGKFFDDVPEYLKPGGRILLGYADASGPKAIQNLEEIISNTGFGVESRQTKRVATHRAKRKWEHIMVYGLKTWS